MQIPTLTIIFSVVSALIAIGTPIALIVVFRKKFRIQAIPVITGAAAFFVFALVLEAMVHNLVLRPDASGNIALVQRPVLYMLYVGFMAGIFEETGRFACFKLLKKRYFGIKTALGYGVGHGGIEAVLLVGVQMIANVFAFISLNSQGVQQFAADSGASSEIAAAAAAVASTPPVMFLAGGVERLLAITIQISLTVFVYYAAYDRKRLYLYPVAILIHATIDFVPTLYRNGLLGQGAGAMWIMEALIGVYAAILVFLAVRLHRRLKPIAPALDITSDN